MGYRWTDIIDIVMDLDDEHPEVDPTYIRFTDLHAWVCALEHFDDKPENSNEKILEAIQSGWMEERA
jgi:FeS assembly protein IscX